MNSDLMNSPSQQQALYLCLDQGGHSSRALVIDARGRILAQAAHAIDTQRDGARVEHDPQQLIDTLQRAADDALAELGAAAANVVAAGLATQRSSIVCWDADSGAALTPVLSWQDTRAADWLAKFDAHWQRVHEVTGLVLSPHYGVSKLVWCLRQLPAVAAAAREGRLRCGPLASFLAMQLTGGKAAADPANASRTLLWDRRSRDWSDELLALFGLSRELLPATTPSRSDWGTLATRYGEIPLTVVTGDQSAALFAFGLPAANVCFANLGTGAFLQRVLTDDRVDPGRLLASVVYQDARHATAVMEATVNGAGSALSEVAAQLGISKDELHANAARWLAGAANPPLFVNAVAGLGSPWWRTDVATGFAGQADAAASAQIAGVLESIVFMLCVNLRHMEDMQGRARRLVATGGLATVAPLLQRLSDLSGLTVERAAVREATATGLAFLLAGLPANWPGVTVAEAFQPQAAGALQARFASWQEVMPPA